MEECSPYLDLLYFLVHKLSQANVKVDDGASGQRIKLITVKVASVVRYDFCPFPFLDLELLVKLGFSSPKR